MTPQEAIDFLQRQARIAANTPRADGFVEVARLVGELAARNAALESGCARQDEEVLQTLGKALGYPWFKDDPGIFPGATAADGVCTGEHVAGSIACEAADRIARLRERAEAGYELSTWAASIHWSDRKSNTPEWLDGLRERIERVQGLANAEGDTGQ